MDGLELNPKIIAACKRCKLLSFEKVLSLSECDLQRLTKLSSAEVKQLHSAVAHSVFKPQHTTGLMMFRGQCTESMLTHRLSTGCPVLDRLLRGGLTSHGITEITGESSGGKTQLCLQLSLTVQLPVSMGGLDAGAVYICTEDSFPNKRLIQLIQHTQDVKLPSHLRDQLDFGRNVFIEHCPDMESLWTCVTRKLPVLMSRRAVRLVLIDSITALFRGGDYERSNFRQRSRDLNRIGASLHTLSSTHNITVVCVNQVTAVLGNQVCEATGRVRSVTPALGLTWSNLVTTRLLITRTERMLKDSTTDPHPPTTDPCPPTADPCPPTCVIRSIEVVSAPHLPNQVGYMVVERGGVRGLE